MAEQQSDKDERAKALFEKNAAGYRNATPWDELHEDTRQLWRDEAKKRAALPELQPLSGETPRTDAAAFDTGLRMNGEDFDEDLHVVVPVKVCRQLERELYVAQNDLGRFEESDRQAQEANDDLREQLADAGDGDTWRDACKRLEAELAAVRSTTQTIDLMRELLEVLESGTERGLSHMNDLAGRIAWQDRMRPLRERLRTFVSAIQPRVDPFNCPGCGAHDFGLTDGKCPHCGYSFPADTTGAGK